jgi:ABC-2 type transport system ATP-binding protein
MERALLVEVRALRKHYRAHVAVDGVDLDVWDGEIVGLVGRNGAGKTTTVECIEGLRTPDGGTVRVFGLDPATDAPAVRSQLGSQQQDSALPDRLRVGEAVDLFSRPGAMPADALLETFGLLEHRRRAFGALSGGQQQRLFLVLALLNRPRLVILDELTQGLDPAARRDVWDAIRTLRDAGTTVLLVTHSMDEAEALCDRIVVMRDGRVVESGSPAALIDRHARWATVRFGDTPNGPSLDDLRRLPGVTTARRTPAGIEVDGNRTMIAHVAAELVRRGDVPADLAVQMPDLESAIVSVLTAPTSDARPSQEVSP